MTVQELIDQLQKVQDKTKKVTVSPMYWDDPDQPPQKSMGNANDLGEVEEFEDQVSLWREI